MTKLTSEEILALAKFDVGVLTAPVMSAIGKLMSNYALLLELSRRGVLPDTGEKEEGET